MSSSKFPSETVDLPSKGWFYPEDHPLASGQIDVFLMTAKHEDILTSRNLIEKGIVLDKLFEALIATPGVKFDDLLVGDKNGLMVAARILGYGKEYDCTVQCPTCGTASEETVNLEELGEIAFEQTPETKGKTEFDFLLPFSKKTVTFKLPTQRDERAIENEVEALDKALGGDVSSVITTRLRYLIVAVDGDRTKSTINAFAETMPIRDSKAFRKHLEAVAPDVDFRVDHTCGQCGTKVRVEVPITASFFWPD